MKRVIKSDGSVKIPEIRFNNYYNIFKLLGFLAVDNDALCCIVPDTNDIILYNDQSGEIYLFSDAVMNDGGSAFLDASQDLDTLNFFLKEHNIQEKHLDIADVFDLLDA